MKRGQALGRGLWSLPGGKVEMGETSEVAALRELLEETTVTATIIGLAGRFSIDAGPARYMISCFAARHLSGIPRAASDASDAKFALPAQILALPLAPHTLDAIAAARTLLGV